MAAMQAREADRPKLEGRVEVDDAYLGGRGTAASAAGGRPARHRNRRCQLDTLTERLAYACTTARSGE